jgi:phenylacetate-CoA ligase
MPFKILLFDLAKGSKVNQYLNKYETLLNKNRDDIIKYQTYRLKKQINHFYKNSEYFRNKMDFANINPNSIKQINDLKRIPVFTREELKNNIDSLVCQNIERNKHFSSSSGTTGIPVKYGTDNDGYSAGIAAGYLLNKMAGWQFSYRQLHIWGNPTSVKRWNKKTSKLKSLVFSKRNIDSTLTNTDEGLFQVIQQIKKFRPESIDGYTTAILNIALYIKKYNIDIPKPKIVITTAENLWTQHKQIIEEVLGPVADFYGCGEINGIAIKPPYHSRYIVFNPHVIVETIDIFLSGLKEILVTDLDNKLLPMIRYRVGDFIDEVISPGESDNPAFDSFSMINGRSVDLVNLPNGKTISPINLFGGTLFRKIGGIEKHKVIWDGEKFIFQFVTNQLYSHKTTTLEISKYLQEYMVDFEIEVVNNILPDKNGKFKYFEKV